LGVLYVVGTPIGNLEDVTLRALRVLGEVALVAAEDTRSARVLLRHHRISTPVTSFHDFTSAGKGLRLVERIKAGDDIALISEAGMPAISDPGYPLIRQALDAGCDVTCVPGPSAVLTALVLSGLPAHAFHYVGFLPRKAGERLRLLQSWADRNETLICFESPHRLVAALRDALQALGPDRPIAVARELTKRYEEVLRTTTADALAHFEQTKPRGEFTLVIGPTSGGK
jgi:16S rRNA (cytidine1402-2'-O)-methyltransferase